MFYMEATILELSADRAISSLEWIRVSVDTNKEQGGRSMARVEAKILAVVHERRCSAITRSAVVSDSSELIGIPFRRCQKSVP